MTPTDPPRPPVLPDCPFCGARWTEEMAAELAAFSSSGNCACCGDGLATPPAAPARDLCCAACGRAIYLRP